jgi:hypothetical protein
MNNYDFRIVCLNCWQATKYDVLDSVKGLPCNRCGETL